MNICLGSLYFRNMTHCDALAFSLRGPGSISMRLLPHWLLLFFYEVNLHDMAARVSAVCKGIYALEIKAARSLL